MTSPAVVLMRCPYCGNAAELVSGERVYPHRHDLAHLRFWRCAPCDAHVGLHEDGRPLGRLADRKLRRLRRQAHDLFDPFWRTTNRRHRCELRRKCYARLAGALGIKVQDCHIGHFDEDLCAAAIDIVRKWGRP